MKKILLLGGSAQQVFAIDTAKRLGLYTVLCDYLPNNPGQFHVDNFYQVSSLDITPVIKIRYMLSKHLGGFHCAGWSFVLKFSSRNNINDFVLIAIQIISGVILYIVLSKLFHLESYT